MFLVDGWEPVSDLYGEISGTLSFWPDGPFNQAQWEALDELAINETWNCIHSASKLSVMTESGKLHSLKKKIVASQISKTMFANSYFDIRFGTLGSGVYPKSVDTDSDAQMFFGPFTFCPLFIDTYSYKTFFLGFERKTMENAGYGNLRPVKTDTTEDLPAKIVETYLAGTAIRRDDIRRLLVPDMKIEEWKAHWSVAVSMLPETRPNPDQDAATDNSVSRLESN